MFLFFGLFVCFIVLSSSKLNFPEDLLNSSSLNLNVENFYSFATSDGNPSDKFTSHSYQTMYGMFLIPLLLEAKAKGKTIKMLEIGLGCGMNYGPGKSALLWKQFFGDTAEIWYGEYNEHCVKHERRAGRLHGLNIVTGDQSNVTTLLGWVNQTSGNFDIIIDDGGHTNRQIKTSFDVLYHHALRPGGLYFIEDLQLGRTRGWGDEDYPVMAEIIESWVDQLLINPGDKWLRDRKVIRMSGYPAYYEIPRRMKWIFCQSEACTIAKCYLNDRSRCS